MDDHPVEMIGKFFLGLMALIVIMIGFSSPSSTPSSLPSPTPSSSPFPTPSSSPFPTPNVEYNRFEFNTSHVIVNDNSIVLTVPNWRQGLYYLYFISDTATNHDELFVEENSSGMTTWDNNKMFENLYANTVYVIGVQIFDCLRGDEIVFEGGFLVQTTEY